MDDYENMTDRRGPYRGFGDPNARLSQPAPPTPPPPPGSFGSILQEAINKSKGK